MDLLDLRADQRAAAAKNEKAGEMYVFAAKQVKCTRCGIVPKSPLNAFFKRADSPLYAAQGGKICVCKDCANKIYDAYCQEHDPMYALMKFCCDFNYYYDKAIAIDLFDNGNFTLGRYIQMIGRQDKGKSFTDNFIDAMGEGRETIVSSATPEHQRTGNWSIEDKKNKDNVVDRIGYDPFIDGGYTDEQLKFLYNTCAGYLTDAVEQDPHKLQNVILMCKTYMQLETIDKLINSQFNAVKPDTQLISSLTTMKEKLTNTTTRIANENGFSEKTGGKTTQGSNTFSGIMRQMFDEDFALSKVNIHDVRMAESFKEIAAMNAHALIEEMNLTGDDYARLCAEQREFTAKLQDENEAITENNRLLQIKIKDLESQLRERTK